MKDAILAFLSFGSVIAFLSALIIGLVEDGFSGKNSESIYATIIISLIVLFITMSLW